VTSEVQKTKKVQTKPGRSGSPDEKVPEVQEAIQVHSNKPNHEDQEAQMRRYRRCRRQLQAHTNNKQNHEEREAPMRKYQRCRRQKQVGTTNQTTKTRKLDEKVPRYM